MVWKLNCENIGHLFSACSLRVSEAQIAYKVTHFEARSHILVIKLLKEVIPGAPLDLRVNMGVGGMGVVHVCEEST